MFKQTIISLFFLLIATNAFAENIRCSLFVNSGSVIDVEFMSLENTKELFVDSTDYRFYLSNKGYSKFELEVFDSYAPSRSYATGYLRTKDDEISWAFWSREVLIETTCKLAK